MPRLASERVVSAIETFGAHIDVDDIFVPVIVHLRRDVPESRQFGDESLQEIV